MTELLVSGNQASANSRPCAAPTRRIAAALLFRIIFYQWLHYTGTFESCKGGDSIERACLIRKIGFTAKIRAHFDNHGRETAENKILRLTVKKVWTNR